MALDNFTVLRYGRSPVRRFGDSRFGICNSLVGSTLHTSPLQPTSMRSSTASANLFTLVASILSLSTASGQTAPAGRFPEPLEKYEMQPAPFVYRLETSPRMISQYGPFVSYQVNVDAQGNNIVGDAANEPSISVDPTDGNKVAIGWRQFNTWQSNFRQSGYGYTTDAGVTWHFPGVL